MLYTLWESRVGQEPEKETTKKHKLLQDLKKKKASASREICLPKAECCFPAPISALFSTQTSTQRGESSNNQHLWACPMSALLMSWPEREGESKGCQGCTSHQLRLRQRTRPQGRLDALCLQSSQGQRLSLCLCWGHLQALKSMSTWVLHRLIRILDIGRCSFSSHVKDPSVPPWLKPRCQWAAHSWLLYLEGIDCLLYSSCTKPPGSTAASSISSEAKQCVCPVRPGLALRLGESLSRR